MGGGEWGGWRERLVGWRRGPGVGAVEREGSNEEARLSIAMYSSLGLLQA